MASGAELLTPQDLENKAMKKNRSSTVVRKQTRQEDHHHRHYQSQMKMVSLKSDSDLKSDNDTSLVNENRPATTGDFILARFATNRRVRHCVGQVLEVDGDEYSDILYSSCGI